MHLLFSFVKGGYLKHRPNRFRYVQDGGKEQKKRYDPISVILIGALGYHPCTYIN